MSNLSNHPSTRYVEIPAYGYFMRWNDELGYGYLPSAGYEYGDAYWKKYQAYVNDFGARLTAARIAFVTDLGLMSLTRCDVGIGSGEYVITSDCMGYDVNPKACEWLKSVGRYVDVYVEPFDVLTFWDVLEHIPDPVPLLNKTQHVIMSLPIYADLSECLLSKHLRPGEHLWHFTDRGIREFMRVHGFSFVAQSSFETDLGREAIQSYYFRKTDK